MIGAEEARMVMELLDQLPERARSAVDVGSALLVGLVASLIPATTAARANVIQVLRG